MNLRELILQNKANVGQFDFEGTTYYFKHLDVGDKNRVIYGARAYQIKLAESQGIELNLDDEKQLQKQLSALYDPFVLARTMASRLCDQDGNLLFNLDSEEDLQQLSSLSNEFIEKFSQAFTQGEPKNSQIAEDSK